MIEEPIPRERFAIAQEISNVALQADRGVGCLLLDRDAIEHWRLGGRARFASNSFSF
ncbi:MAG TPA: hypothetical protein VII01_06480 [Solirubrobacteraceae bacterium]|jgi:hypothetical protein